MPLQFQFVQAEAVQFVRSAYHDHHTIAKLDRGVEGAVDAAGGHGEHPRREVGHGGRLGPGVAAAARDDDAALGGVQRPQGDAVVREPQRRPRGPDGDAHDVDAVADRVVHGGQHVGLEAGVLDVGVGPRDGPAHLVDGQARQRRPARGRPVREPAQRRHARHGAAGHGGRRVGAVPVVVARRPEGVRRVEALVVRLIGLDVVSCPYDLPACSD